MDKKELNQLFVLMAAGEVPDFWQVLSALNELPELLTLDSRPGESVDAGATCSPYGCRACQD